MWYVFQAAVMIGVAFHSIAYEWNKNALAVGVAAIVAAMLATWLLSSLLSAGRRLGRRAERQEDSGERVAIGRFDAVSRPKNGVDRIGAGSENPRKLL